jgi:hypothetical protein
LTTGTRQSLTPRAAVTLGPHRRAPLLCRGLGPRQRWTLTEGVSLPRARPSAKKPLPKVTLCRGLALGKDVLYRVPEIRPSAKQKTLGSVAVSSSDETGSGQCRTVTRRCCWCSGGTLW